jgi:hypothetical protein
VVAADRHVIAELRVIRRGKSLGVDPILGRGRKKNVFGNTIAVTDRAEARQPDGSRCRGLD